MDNITANILALILEIKIYSWSPESDEYSGYLVVVASISG